MQDRYYRRLVFFYGVYFVGLGFSGFCSVFLAGKGMDNGQIGMLQSIPPLLAMALQPLWGLAGDRAKYKRTVLAVALGASGVFCLALNQINGFWLLLLTLIVYHCFAQAVSPAAQTIGMEYTMGSKLGFGPIRVSGSITYQITALLTGFLFAGSMDGLYRAMGVVFLLSGAMALTLPPVEGHQHRQKRMNPFGLLKDKRILLLFMMTFAGRLANVFYMAFYNKHTQELFGNSVMSVLAFLAVVMEIPFLFFANRLMRKCKVTTWVLMGLGVNAMRFAIIFASTSLPVLAVVQLPAFSIMGFFDFFPMLYMNAIVPREMRGSIQSLNTLICVGIPQLLGTLAGGFIANALGIQAAFGLYGAIMLLALALFCGPAKKANLLWPDEV